VLGAADDDGADEPAGALDAPAAGSAAKAAVAIDSSLV
jgi:hypothetical protein